FSEQDQFEPAERLLMDDRFVRATFSPTEDYPVAAFVTDASLETVSEFFSKRFGEPHGPVAGSQQRIAELTVQLTELQSQAAGGDQKAIEKLRAVLEELASVQEIASLDAYLQLSAIHAENDLVWLDGNVEDAATQVMRVVTAGEDHELGKTVIRYINAPASQLGGSGGEGGTDDGSGNGDDDGQAGTSSSPSDAGAPSQSPPGPTSDGGCGCAIPGAPRQASTFAALGILALLLRRARRCRR
ncbi:MAG TPA: MYXO-CTERM sorting domain-containing protein, partial [Polyangiaceae bacterium]|nr:MYXO-CTERM sorting domain-containing protein [Polyangiaceae bacterium]